MRFIRLYKKCLLSLFRELPKEPARARLETKSIHHCFEQNIDCITLGSLACCAHIDCSQNDNFIVINVSGDRQRTSSMRFAHFSSSLDHRAMNFSMLCGILVQCWPSPFEEFAMDVRSPRASVLSAALGLTAAGTITSAAFVSLNSGLNKGTVGAPASTPAAESAASAEARKRTFDLANTSAMLYRVGLDPESLAAAGFTPEQTDSVIAAMMVHVSTLEHMTLIDQATANVRTRQERDASGGRAANAGGTRPPARPTAQDGDPPRGRGPSRAVVGAQRSLGNLLQAARNQALSGIPADQVAILDNLWANAAWEVPVQFRAVNRTPDEWKALKGALAARHHAQRRGLALDPAVAAVLSAAESNPIVSVVSDSMNARRSSVEELFRQRLTTTAPVDPTPAPR
jgi:hypothetical protein